MLHRQFREDAGNRRIGSLTGLAWLEPRRRQREAFVVILIRRPMSDPWPSGQFRRGYSNQLLCGPLLERASHQPMVISMLLKGYGFDVTSTLAAAEEFSTLRVSA